jgi:hypothetical protein
MNKVVRRVQKQLKTKHHFTTANCPWSTALSSPNESKSYVLSVLCYLSLGFTQTRGLKWSIWYGAS